MQGTERLRTSPVVPADGFPRRQPVVERPFGAPGPDRPSWADHATFEVRWRARIVEGSGSTAEGRFTRVVDELADTRQIGNPAHDFEPDSTFVTFTFQVERVGYTAVAVEMARQALDAALANARVGAPYPPTSHTVTQVSVVLETRPLSVKPVAA
jgi:hypothetical protein